MMQTQAIDTSAAGMKYRREYQRSLSKHRMNDSKYRVSGNTHRNGTLATSRQTWFVVAKSSTDGIIASMNHNSQIPQPGEASSAGVKSEIVEETVCPRAADVHAQIAHNR